MVFEVRRMEVSAMGECVEIIFAYTGPEYEVGLVEAVTVDFISDFAWQLKERTAGLYSTHIHRTVTVSVNR